MSAGDGLYKDKTSSGGWIYKGANPNNFLLLEEKCFSIIRIDDNKEIKIVYEGPTINGTCKAVRQSNSGGFGPVIAWSISTSNKPSWQHEETIIRVALEAMITDKSFLNDYSKIANHTWNIGVINYQKYQTLETDMALERSITWNNKVGLINPSVYIKSSWKYECTSIYESNYAWEYNDKGEYAYTCSRHNYTNPGLIHGP